MNTNKTKGFLSVALLAAVLLTNAIYNVGCSSTKLEAGGSFAPVATNSVSAASAIGFYAVDAAYDLAYATVDTAFNFERNNRAVLWRISPEVKHGLDSLRPQLDAVRLKYALARQAYLRSKSDA